MSPAVILPAAAMFMLTCARDQSALVMAEPGLGFFCDSQRGVKKPALRPRGGEKIMNVPFWVNCAFIPLVWGTLQIAVFWWGVT